MDKKTFELWDSVEKRVVCIIAQRMGNNWRAICPKHSDKDPSLSISLEKRMFHCFGCGWSGKLNNAFKIDNLEMFEEKEERRKIKKINQGDYIFLKDSELGMRYWKNRGFEEWKIDSFEVEYNKKENRIAFPVFDAYTDKLEFYVERNIFNVEHKYHISSGACKTKTFFNIKNAKKCNKIQTWLCEGTFDCLAVGSNSLGLIGKSISDEQIEILKHFNFKQLIIALDNDVKRSEIFKLKERLKIYFDVRIYETPQPYKDLAEMYQKTRKIINF